MSLAATFLPWMGFFDENAWSAYPGLAVALVVSAALALVPRAALASALVALATVVAVVVVLRGDILAAATAGPAVAFLGLTAIAAGGVGLRARPLIAVGAFALLVSTFAPWTHGAIEGAYFNRSVGAPAFAFAGDGGDLWSGLDGSLAVGPWLAAAALATLVVGAIQARSR